MRILSLSLALGNFGKNEKEWLCCVVLIRHWGSPPSKNRPYLSQVFLWRKCLFSRNTDAPTIFCTAQCSVTFCTYRPLLLFFRSFLLRCSSFQAKREACVKHCHVAIKPHIGPVLSTYNFFLGLGMFCTIAILYSGILPLLLHSFFPIQLSSLLFLGLLNINSGAIRDFFLFWATTIIH